MRLQIKILILFLLVLLGGCSAIGGDLISASRIARVEVVDQPNYMKELYRYVRWNNESYGPTAFVGSARGEISAIVLLNAKESGLRCVASLSKSLQVPASFLDGSSEAFVSIAPSSEAIEDACSIPSEVPHPRLGAAQYYVSKTDTGLSIEGEDPTNPTLFTNQLRAIGASAIVLRNPSIAELLCFGAVAAAAKVKLFQVNLNGTFSQLKVSGTPMSKACSF